jgi:hypothetical protein
VADIKLIIIVGRTDMKYSCENEYKGVISEIEQHWQSAGWGEGREGGSFLRHKGRRNTKIKSTWWTAKSMDRRDVNNANKWKFHSYKSKMKEKWETVPK